MNIMTEINNRHENSVLLESFDIQDKCLELEEIIIKRRYDLFQAANVVITVPTMDESYQYIRKDHPELFDKQCKDAEVLALYLTDNGANIINIIKDINREIDDCLGRIGERLNGGKLDYFICLHQFTNAEKDFIVQTLNEETCSNVTVIELY